MIVVGLDTGERSNKTAACYGDDMDTVWGEGWEDKPVHLFSAPLDALKHIKSRVRDQPVRVCTELTFAYSVKDFDEFKNFAVNNGIELYVINPRNTCNRRRDHTSLEKSEEIDSRVLLQIGIEKKIARINPDKRKYSKPSHLHYLRQREYDVRFLEPFLPGICEAERFIFNAGFPKSAFAANLNEPRSSSWHKSCAFYSLLVVVYRAKVEGRLSYRHVKKELWSKRGIARSNLVFHALNGKRADERKRILQAQNRVAKWMINEMKRHYGLAGYDPDVRHREVGQYPMFND